MTLTKIDSEKFRDMVRVASHRLSKNANFVNSLNVFPVPDGDTGTNMSLSFQSGAKEVSLSNSDSVGVLSQCLAKGLLMGARGNSGVISSQLFRGFAKRVNGLDVLTSDDLVDAFVGGVETAYKAVMKPVEGTILTVAREGAKAGLQASKETNDVIEVMKKIVDGSRAALESTPKLLPVLNEVGVVDSGGQGLVFIYEGFLEGLSGKFDEDIYKPSELEMDEMLNATHHQSVQSQLSTNDIKKGYCTEMMIKLPSNSSSSYNTFDYNKFCEYLNEIGDSLLAVADDEIVKVHIHTEHPGLVWEYGEKFGKLSKIKIDNMRIQHESIIEKDVLNSSLCNDSVKKKVDYGVVAVASGSGLSEIFKSLGVTKIINGGRTMNPSIKEIIDAVESLNAKRVIILPNNSNILMTAEQAAKESNIPTAVVPSKTISQGMTAMFSFNPNNSLKENINDMTSALLTVISGKITRAIKSTTINDITINKDDYIGIIDGNVRVVKKECYETLLDTILKMINEDSEVITILIGEDGSKYEAQEVKNTILSKYPDMEIEIHFGNQPIYNYLLSVE